jgi:predicted RNase H-like nuclease (RuvC/YqgF family)
MVEVNTNTENVRYLIPPQTPKLLWVVICLLALVVAGQGWYIHQVDLRSAASATTVAGQASLSDLKARLDALETNQRDWNRHAMTVDARFDALATNQKDWNRHVMAMDSRADKVDQLENAELSRLEKELAESRREVASLRSESATATR